MYMYVCTLKSNGPIMYIPLYVCIYFSLTKTLKFMFVSKFASFTAVYCGLRYDDQAQLRDPGSPGFLPEYLEMAEQLFLSQGEPYR